MSKDILDFEDIELDRLIENDSFLANDILSSIDPTTIVEEVNTLIDNDKIVATEVISRGAISKPDFWYDQEQGEFIYMLKGMGVIRFEDGSEERLNKGSNIYIAPHIKHQVAYTSLDAVWLCVFSK